MYQLLLYPIRYDVRGGAIRPTHTHRKKKESGGDERGRGFVGVCEKKKEPSKMAAVTLHHHFTDIVQLFVY
jgi:hypothetical protein